MKYLIPFSAIVIALAACNGNDKTQVVDDKRIHLYRDTINVVKRSDTLTIYESTCRGCAYEGSTKFEIEDSSGIIKLERVITSDNNPDGMAGGSIGKTLVFVPQKTGKTTFKLYKFWSENTRAKDSALFVPYTVDVKN